MSLDSKDTAASIGLLILRVGVGSLMMSHGWGKLQTLFAGKFDQFPDPIGLGSGLSLGMAVMAEFGCSILLIAGLATRVAALPLAFTMIVAALVVHGGDPLLSATAAKAFRAGEARTWASKEPALLYLVPFLTLIFTGAGRFSIDGMLASRRRRRRERHPDTSTTTTERNSV